MWRFGSVFIALLISIGAPYALATKPTRAAKSAQARFACFLQMSELTRQGVTFANKNAGVHRINDYVLQVFAAAGVQECQVTGAKGKGPFAVQVPFDGVEYPMLIGESVSAIQDPKKVERFDSLTCSTLRDQKANEAWYAGLERRVGAARMECDKEGVKQEQCLNQFVKGLQVCKQVKDLDGKIPHPYEKNAFLNFSDYVHDIERSALTSIKHVKDESTSSATQ